MPERTTTDHLPRTVWVLGFVSLFMDVSSEIIHSLLPVFLVSVLGASAVTVGVIEGVAAATAMIVKLFSGALSDALGRRKPLALAGYALGMLSKPLFAIAGSPGMVLAARFTDRIGKGIRGAPRDALVADVTPPAMRGAAYGLRQSLDTVGAVVGPLLAVGLMWVWANDFRAVFLVATLPGLVAVGLLWVGVHEDPPASRGRGRFPLHREQLRLLSRSYWKVVVVGVIFTLARFSEAFLILHAQERGLPLVAIPLVLVVLNLVYSASSYPFGKLSDRVGRLRLLVAGMAVLIAADVVLALAGSWAAVLVGVALWGLHLGMTQGLLSALVADTAPDHLRGTAFGVFNLCCGVATLAASVIAGLCWEGVGPELTFALGGLFCLLSLVLLLAARRGGLPSGG